MGKSKLIPSLYRLKYMMRIWPPYVGAGVRVTKISPDSKEMQTKMKLRWYNKNMMGTHFGGNLYSMSDPFYAILLLYHLGDEYYVWDKSSSIDFIRPSKNEVRADFCVTDAQIEEIVEAAREGEAIYRDFEVNVVDSKDKLVAKVVKTMYIRRKPQD